MLLLYGLSLTLFYVDFLRDNRFASRSGVVLLGSVWVLESLYMGVQIAVDHALPLFSAGQATIFFAWLLITVSFSVSLLSRIDYFTFFINLLGFLFVGFDLFVRGKGGTHSLPKLSDLLFVHVSLAIASYVAFTLSCIFSALYLLADTALRLKRFASGPFRRLPPLQQLDVYAFRSALVGGPLLLIAMILGAVWYVMLKGQLLVLDPKPIFSIILCAWYVAYLYFRARGRISGRRAAWFNISAYVGVLINFLIIGEFMSQFHKW